MADVKFVHYGVQKEGTFTPGKQDDGSYIGEADDSVNAAYDCFQRVGVRHLDRNGVTYLDRMLMAKDKKVKSWKGQKCYFHLKLPK